jgi:transposase
LAHPGPYYSDIGRPSIDPELMMRMLIVGYCSGIRSERRLCDEVHVNLAAASLCALRCTAGTHRKAYQSDAKKLARVTT